MVVCVVEDNVRFARSHAVRKRRRARGLPEISFLCLRLNSSEKCRRSLESKSSPPKCVSPAVALTSKIPPSMFSTETSNVPPPRSKMSTFISSSLFLSRPYAIAAAVGSLIIRRQFRPAIVAASFVACRCESLK